MPGWMSGQTDKANGAKPNGTEVVHLVGYDEFGQLYLAAAQDSGVKANVQKYTATAEAFLQTEVDQYLSGAKPEAIAKAGMSSWASKGAAVVTQILDIITLALGTLADVASKVDAIAPGLGELLKQVLKTGADFVQTVRDWFKAYVVDGGLGLYLTADMADILFANIKADKKRWLKIILFAFAANQARDGMPFAEAYYNVRYAASSSVQIAQFQAADGYELPYNVWATLKDAGVPVGVAACPALHLEYIVLGVQYANNPSFREMAAQYVGGYSAAQAKQAKLTELWPLAANKYLAGKSNTSIPDKAKIEKAVKLAYSAFEQYGGSSFDAWVNYQKDGDPLPYKQPAALTKHDVATYAAIACQGYLLTPMQQVRVDCTANGYAMLGFAIQVAGGLPAGMVSQAGVAPKVPEGGTVDAKGNLNPQLRDNTNKLGLTPPPKADNTVPLVVGGVAAAVVVGVLV